MPKEEEKLAPVEIAESNMLSLVRWLLNNAYDKKEVRALFSEALEAA